MKILFTENGSCNFAVENKTIFELTSLGYPNGYPTNKECELRIKVEDNHVVELTFLEFSLELDTNCR